MLHCRVLPHDDLLARYQCHCQSLLEVSWHFALTLQYSIVAQNVDQKQNVAEWGNMQRCCIISCRVCCVYSVAEVECQPSQCLSVWWKVSGSLCSLSRLCIKLAAIQQCYATVTAQCARCWYLENISSTKLCRLRWRSSHHSIEVVWLCFV